jgi:hypothetical protein
LGIFQTEKNIFNFNPGRRYGPQSLEFFVADEIEG